MTADTLKSNALTDLDGTNSIITYPNPNDFGPGIGVTLVDFVTPTTGGLVSTASIYKLCRLPSTATLKCVELQVGAKLDTGGASAALLVDFGAYYSDSLTDGTLPANQGTSISANCFVAAHSFGTTADGVATGVASRGDFNIDGLYSMNRNLLGAPLWKQAGLAADPGGFIDLVLAVHTAANAAQASPIGIYVEYSK